MLQSLVPLKARLSKVRTWMSLAKMRKSKRDRIKLLRRSRRSPAQSSSTELLTALDGQSIIALKLKMMV